MYSPLLSDAHARPQLTALESKLAASKTASGVDVALINDLVRNELVVAVRK